MILITGGARSGKSGLAERLTQHIAEQYAEQHAQQDPVLYIATSVITDAEMAQRVALHRQSRCSSWHTHEGHQHLGDVIQQQAANYSVILIECITTLITNLLFDHAGDGVTEDEMDFVAIESVITQQIDALIAACEHSPCEVVIVTNELGLGVVPEHRLARHFRDIAGRTNQKLAQAAHEVHLVISGIDMKIKG